MKKTGLFISFIILCLLLIKTQIISQTSLDSKKIESIILLTRFIDWSQNERFSNQKKLLYVISDNNLPINTEISSKKDFDYKDWQIICKDKLTDVETGSVVYITEGKKCYISDLIRLSSKKDILTITENDETFCKNGGMINLNNDQKRVKFEINYKIIRNKSLNISSKVLALAKIYD